MHGPSLTAAAGDEPRGLIFDVQRFSLHDGAGIRTLVFLKGCPLRCAWCSNPESQAVGPQLVYARSRCIGAGQCDRCLTACSNGAITWGEDARAAVDRHLCDDCGECARVCPSRALQMSGTRVSVDDAIRTVEQDGSFYVRSGGGLTVSGGEPLLQHEFVARLLAKARSRGLATAVETSGLCTWQALEQVIPHTDEVFYDIKCIDDAAHRRATSLSNRPILANFRKLRRHFPDTPVVVRTAVVPGFNDSPREIAAIAEFIAGAGGATAYELLAYHGFGEPKYEKLGRSYALSGTDAPPPETMAALRRVADRVSTGVAPATPTR